MVCYLLSVIDRDRPCFLSDARKPQKMAMASKAELKVGDKVQAKYGPADKFYPARVVAISNTRRRNGKDIQVVFDGYEGQVWKALHELELNKHKKVRFLVPEFNKHEKERQEPVPKWKRKPIPEIARCRACSCQLFAADKMFACLVCKVAPFCAGCFPKHRLACLQFQ